LIGERVPFEISVVIIVHSKT